MSFSSVLFIQVQVFLSSFLWESGTGCVRFNQDARIRDDVHNCTGLDEMHFSQIRDRRWNGHTFHASSCCIWMDVGTSSTEIYPVSMCERQMVVKVCFPDYPSTACCLFLSLLSNRKWYQDLICEQDTLICFYGRDMLNYTEQHFPNLSLFYL